MLYWFTAIDAYGIPWKFYLCNPDDIHLEGETGITDPVINNVYVCNRGTEEAIKIVAFHELMHVNWSAPGYPTRMSSMLGVKLDKVDKVEEDIVAETAPSLYAMLTKNGYLKIPDLPEDIK